MGRECGKEEGQAKVCVCEERGGERRVEFSKEGDVRCDPQTLNTVTVAKPVPSYTPSLPLHLGLFSFLVTAMVTSPEGS